MPGGKSIIVRVEDDGPGVPYLERDNIFKPFYQLKDSQPQDRIGTGIGLSLLKSLTVQLGGSVKVGDSEFGGALFEVCIPCNMPAFMTLPDTDTAEETHEKETEASELEEESPKDMIPSVMIVDDNKDMRRFLADRLHKMYNITECADGLEAVGLLDKGKRFDLIISDVMMPGMDGYELCTKVKGNIMTSHIPMILLTAKADNASKIEGLETGAEIYLEKPFSLDMLLAQIHSILLNRKHLYDKFATSPVDDNIFLATTKADKEFLSQVNGFIQENIRDTSFIAEDIAVHVGMSRSAFFTKLRSVTGQTPSSYVRIVRLKKAVEYFHNGETRINEVCYMVGFNSHSYFSKCFAQQFGMTPTTYVMHLHDNAEIQKQQITQI